MKALVFLCIVAGAALVYLMSEASANNAVFARNYQLLFYIGIGLAAGLGSLIVYQLILLRRKMSARVFGSKLTLKLVLGLTAMVLIAGTPLYMISFQFLQRSIESWFDVRLDESMKRGLQLGQRVLQASLKDLQQKGEAMSVALANAPGDEQATLNRLRDLYSIDEATLLTTRRGILAHSTADPVSLLPDLPSPDVLRQVRTQQRVAKIEPIGERGLYLRVLIPVSSMSISDDARALQLVQKVPTAIAEDAQLAEKGYTDYSQLVLARTDLKNIFLLSLTLAMLVTFFSAIAFAFYFSDWLSAPL